MRISYWSSDVCSSDLRHPQRHRADRDRPEWSQSQGQRTRLPHRQPQERLRARCRLETLLAEHRRRICVRSEEHTSELQSLMRISYAVFCLKKKTMSQQRNTKNLPTKTQK